MAKIRWTNLPPSLRQHLFDRVADRHIPADDLYKLLVAGARGTVLDLGSGTGRNLPLLPYGTTAVALEEAARRLAGMFSGISEFSRLTSVMEPPNILGAGG